MLWLLFGYRSYERLVQISAQTLNPKRSKLLAWKELGNLRASGPFENSQVIMGSWVRWSGDPMSTPSFLRS